MCEDLAENPTTITTGKVVIMSGGSHVLHWYPAYRVLADKYGWKLVVIDKDACRLTIGDDGDGLSQMCRDWNTSAMPIILDREPAAVVTVATKTPEVPGDVEISYPGQVRAWQDLADHDVPVIAMRDTPRFFERIPECTVTATNPNDCGRARSDIFADEIPTAGGLALPASTAIIDLTDAFCSQETCEPIIGNVLAYRDEDHMTATYARTLAPALETALKSEAPWLFR